jgi:hypothetical protein
MSRGATIMLGSTLLLLALGFAGVAWFTSGLDGQRASTIGMIVLAVFCLVGALACSSAASRPVTLRLIGATVFLVFAAYLIEMAMKGPVFGKTRSEPSLASAIVAFLVFGLPAGYIAFRGLYPNWGRHAAAFGGAEPKMKYDDASWHSGGDFPKDLPEEAAATHTGMFVAWALLSGLGGEIHVEDGPGELEALTSRDVTPGAFFMSMCDGKFTDEDLNDEGNAFARDYFVFDTGKYLQDYEKTVGSNLASLYHVADTWETFDRLKPVLDERFREWKASGGGKPK